MMLLLVGTLCALVVTASAGYASSSSGGYAGAGGVPVGPYATPYDFQNQFQQYYNSLPSYIAKKQLTTSYAGEGASVSAYASLSPPKSRYENEEIKNLFAQQLAYQAALQNQIQYNIDAIRNQAYGGGYGYGGYPAYNGASAGSGAYAGSGSYTGGSVGSYGGVSGGQSYGGTSGGRPNYASAGGSVGNGYQHQHAGVYPANPARPNLDSRFGGDTGVTHTRGPGGFVGVSSFSSSSDINGVKNREASTSVNNNGKVTTYYTRN